MKSQRREKIARRSSSYISCDVYHDDGRARTVEVFETVAGLGESAGFPKPKKLTSEVAMTAGAGENDPATVLQAAMVYC